MKKRLTALALFAGLIFALTAGAFANDEAYISDAYAVAPWVAEAYYNQLGSWWAVDQSLYVSEQTGLPPETVIHMHLMGESFAQIAIDFGMQPGTYATLTGADFIIESGMIAHRQYLASYWWRDVNGHMRYHYVAA